MLLQLVHLLLPEIELSATLSMHPVLVLAKHLPTARHLLVEIELSATLSIHPVLVLAKHLPPVSQLRASA